MGLPNDSSTSLGIASCIEIVGKLSSEGLYVLKGCLEDELLGIDSATRLSLKLF